jgi:type VI secretion system protein ImpF
MAADELQAEMTPTLLDRLMDRNPQSSREEAANDWEQARELRSALCRDLAVLLNTRRASEDFDGRYEEAGNSLLSFGITDFTSHNLKKGVQQEQLRKSIEQSIRRFEPRLDHVDVTLQESEAGRPVVRFQVSAVLRTRNQDAVFFEATLHRDSRRFGVSGGA